MIFLDAPGGTGKTYLTNLLLAKVRSTGRVALAVASSGIAATLLSGGKTAHSTFFLPPDLHQAKQPTCSKSRESEKALVLRQRSLIIWDECTMSHKNALEVVDRTLKDIQCTTVKFGNGRSHRCRLRRFQADITCYTKKYASRQIISLHQDVIPFAINLKVSHYHQYCHVYLTTYKSFSCCMHSLSLMQNRAVHIQDAYRQIFDVPTLCSMFNSIYPINPTLILIQYLTKSTKFEKLQIHQTFRRYKQHHQ